MPSSIRTIDATAQRYDPVESLPSSPEKSAHSRKLASHMNLPPSPPAETEIRMHQANSSPAVSATQKEEARITRDLSRGAPGDGAIFSSMKTPEQKELAKRKSQYYGEVFAHRESSSSARERVTRESPIIADVRTNVIVNDEYTLITDLSYFLSSRYQRPESCIVVSLTHSCCMLFGGTFDPAYNLTITALGSQLQPVTNKRNAALLAKQMEEGLGVGPERGVIKFVAIGEENLACQGKTVAGEIEELEREMAETNVNLQRSLSRGTAKTDGKRRQSMKSLRGPKRSSLLPTHNEKTPPTSDRDSPPLPAIPTEMSYLDRKAEKVQKVGRRKSFIASLFGKS